MICLLGFLRLRSLPTLFTIETSGMSPWSILIKIGVLELWCVSYLCRASSAAGNIT
jgi:hypothetical protein